MSIYKQIFATASIFAIAASALVSPVGANAQQTISVNPTSTGNYVYCLPPVAPATVYSIAPVGYNVVDSTNNTAMIYVVASANSNTSTQTCTGTPTVINLPAMPGHTTSYDLNGGAGTTAVTATNVKVKNTALSAANVVKTCDGAKTILTITGTDGDGVNHVSNSIPTADYDVTPSGDKPLKITVAKKSGSTSTGTTGSFIYVKEILPTVTTPATPSIANPAVVAYTVDAVAENIQLVANIDAACVVTVASSSMSSSSMMAVSSAKPVVATTDVDAPSMNSAKGTSTVRTGGAL